MTRRTSGEEKRLRREVEGLRRQEAYRQGFEAGLLVGVVFALGALYLEARLEARLADWDWP